jgi:hypothetical protein
MSKPIQIAVAMAHSKSNDMEVIEERVLCDDGRIFARTLGYSDESWTEVHGPWEKK